MTVRCLECGYEMRVLQAAISMLAHDAEFYSGFSNQKIGEYLGAQCPKCGTHDHWEDK